MTQYLEAGIKELVDEFQSNGKACPSEQTIAERRNGYIASTVLAGDNVTIDSEFLDVVNDIEVKVYKPTSESDLPITVYFHGGCFVSGGFATHDIQLRQIALQSNSIVVCIKYRLAPEFTYPAAHDDVYQAVLGITENGHKWGGDTQHLTFVGDSAGGQLALATTLRLKKLQQWLPRKQILIYPMLDLSGNSQSYNDNATDYVITAKMLLSGFNLYTNDDPDVKTKPELNLLSADFSGLPTTSIITAEYDPLRDEGELLYKLMLAQGVDAYCERYLGVVHGFFQLAGISGAAKRCITSIANQVAS